MRDEARAYDALIARQHVWATAAMHRRQAEQGSAQANNHQHCALCGTDRALSYDGAGLYNGDHIDIGTVWLCAICGTNYREGRPVHDRAGNQIEPGWDDYDAVADAAEED